MTPEEIEAFLAEPDVSILTDREAAVAAAVAGYVCWNPIDDRYECNTCSTHDFDFSDSLGQNLVEHVRVHHKAELREHLRP